MSHTLNRNSLGLCAEQPSLASLGLTGTGSLSWRRQHSGRSEEWTLARGGQPLSWPARHHGQLPITKASLHPWCLGTPMPPSCQIGISSTILQGTLKLHPSLFQCWVSLALTCHCSASFGVPYLGAALFFPFSPPTNHIPTPLKSKSKEDCFFQPYFCFSPLPAKLLKSLTSVF